MQTVLKLRAVMVGGRGKAAVLSNNISSLINRSGTDT